jgi:hypothetical protein
VEEDDAMTDDNETPPPMFAECPPVDCIALIVEQPECANYKGDGNECGWFGLDGCTNPLACVQAHRAALAKLGVKP